MKIGCSSEDKFHVFGNLRTFGCMSLVFGTGNFREFEEFELGGQTIREGRLRQLVGARKRYLQYASKKKHLPLVIQRRVSTKVISEICLGLQGWNLPLGPSLLDKIQQATHPATLQS